MLCPEKHNIYMDVLAVAPIIWVSRSIIIYRKLLLSHFILFRNKLILKTCMAVVKDKSNQNNENRHYNITLNTLYNLINIILFVKL